MGILHYQFTLHISFLYIINQTPDKCLGYPYTNIHTCASKHTSLQINTPTLISLLTRTSTSTNITACDNKHVPPVPPHSPYITYIINRGLSAAALHAHASHKDSYAEGRYRAARHAECPYSSAATATQLQHTRSCTCIRARSRVQSFGLSITRGTEKVSHARVQYTSPRRRVTKNSRVGMYTWVCLGWWHCGPRWRFKTSFLMIFANAAYTLCL